MQKHFEKKKIKTLISGLLLCINFQAMYTHGDWNFQKSNYQKALHIPQHNILVYIISNWTKKRKIDNVWTFFCFTKSHRKAAAKPLQAENLHLYLVINLSSQLGPHAETTAFADVKREHPRGAATAVQATREHVALIIFHACTRKETIALARWWM